jgi:hydrogenase maturation protein HypF
MAVELAEKYGVRTIALSGGSFQNDVLRRGLCASLTSKGFRVIHNRLVPVNDGGISLGQVVAAGF